VQLLRMGPVKGVSKVIVAADAVAAPAPDVAATTAMQAVHDRIFMTDLLRLLTEPMTLYPVAFGTKLGRQGMLGRASRNRESGDRGQPCRHEHGPLWSPSPRRR
jgi:hypothetical protein